MGGGGGWGKKCWVFVGGRRQVGVPDEKPQAPVSGPGPFSILT